MGILGAAGSSWVPPPLRWIRGESVDLSCNHWQPDWLLWTDLGQTAISRTVWKIRANWNQNPELKVLSSWRSRRTPEVLAAVCSKLELWAHKVAPQSDLWLHGGFASVDWRRSIPKMVQRSMRESEWLDSWPERGRRILLTIDHCRSVRPTLYAFDRLFLHPDVFRFRKHHCLQFDTTRSS